ncbi:MAG: FtsX-like permease family protein [Clostridium chrysemydis]|uniref:FtsX-like permease family protein n=1 Tax=Clostridium chrysemydis TaxID=2665504 RepID=UPI003F355CA8
MRADRKSIVREILSSKARFFSIMVIIFLGVAFYSGIKSAGPDMNKTINKYYEDKNLMDSKVISTLGLSDEDLNLLKNDDKVLDYYGSHTIDANLTNMSNVVRFMEYDKNNNINKFEVLEGRLPENEGEIALDEKAFKLNKGLKIGDEFVIKSDKDTMKNFKKEKYKIVGKVKNPMYIEKESRGVTNVGKGTIDYFGVLNSEDIKLKPYTEIYLRFKNVQGLDAYSDEYKDLTEENNKYLEELFKDRIPLREEEVKSDIKKEFKAGYEEIEKNEKLLNEKEKDLKEAREKLEKGKEEYKKNKKEFEENIEKNEAKLKDGERKLQDGKLDLQNKSKQIIESEKALDLAKDNLEKAKEEFLKSGVDPDSDSKEIKSNIENLDKLSSGLNLLSKDIKNTVDNLKEGEEIPKEKILYWKQIGNTLGLTELNSYFENLEKDPKNKELAYLIVSTLNEKIKEVDLNKDKLQKALISVNEYKLGKSEYEKGLNKLNSGKEKINIAQNQIELKSEEIEDAKNSLEKGKTKGEDEFLKAKNKLEDSERKLISGEKAIKENKEKIATSKKDIEEKEKSALDHIKNIKYIVFDRTDNQGYSGYKDSINSLDSIAKVLPVFFFIVAILICLTTMTRMVEEKRIEIGTMKALGYGNLSIALKFIVYASLASVLGCLLGLLVGSNIIPSIISNAYTSVYGLPKVETYYYPLYIIQSLVISVLCTVGAAMFVVRVELKDKPCNLMRPKAPKLGKKIFLERITPLWKRLSFNQKVTFRNLFRYKQRMFMTIFGIAGCMALLVTGFGLKDSNNGIVTNQFDKLWKYETMVIFSEDQTKEEIDTYNKTLKSLKGYENNLEMSNRTISFTKEGMNKQVANLYVPKDSDRLSDFVVLNDIVSKENYRLPDDGVIINEKLAKLLGVTKGDTIEFKDDDENSYKVKVSGVFENYIMHSVYMSDTYYEKVFKEKPTYNTDFINFNPSTIDENEISSKLMDCKNVINVTEVSDMKKTTEESAANMNVVMLVIILSAGSLAFVVLYNLNNINVSERIRELSTIKVLGFFDDEVTMYILRENIILTLLGVISGGVLGNLLHKFIIITSETDTMMMYPKIAFTSYIFASLITIFFSVVVMLLMHIKLRKVNMIDALKSNE